MAHAARGKPVSEFYRRLLDLVNEGRRVAVATLIEVRGSTPQALGGKMIVLEDGSIAFTIGGGALEAEVIAEARACLAAGRSALKSYGLHEQGEDALGMACGGRATVFIEVILPAERLVVVGAGHVGRALARLAQPLGFALDVVDDRSAMLEPAAFPGGARLHLTDRLFRENWPALDPRSFVAIVTRCHDTDEAALRALLDTPLAYVGMIGSQRKVQVVFDRMVESGVPREALARVHAPIGVPIGSHRPEEVAISILAEMLAVRNGLPGAAGSWR